MFYLRPPDAHKMASVLAACERDAPSYEEVGATQDEVLPSGFHHVHAERRLGDPSLFERAVVGLESWKAHEGAGMSIFPARSRLTPDATVLTSIKIGPLTMVAPCRIIRRWESTTTFGFAYATLPGHPESGEESFSLERRNDGAFFVIRAFSRPASLLVRLGGPAGPAVQRLVTRKYVEGLQTFVS